MVSSGARTVAPGRSRAPTRPTKRSSGSVGADVDDDLAADPVRRDDPPDDELHVRHASVRVDDVDPHATPPIERDHLAQRLGGTAAPADHRAEVVGVDADLEPLAPATVDHPDPDVVRVLDDALDQVLERRAQGARQACASAPASADSSAGGSARGLGGGASARRGVASASACGASASAARLRGLLGGLLRLASSASARPAAALRLGLVRRRAVGALRRRPSAARSARAGP